MRCPRWLPKALTPLYRIRGIIVVRTYTYGPSSVPARLLRHACERVINAVEMWEAAPMFERMQEHQDALDEIAVRLDKLAEEFGLDLKREGSKALKDEETK